MKKKWVLPSVQKENQELLVRSLQISPLLAVLLLNRGIDSPEAAEAFLAGGLDQLHSPWLMTDMDKAILRIKRSLDSGESVVVYGDYDVDGQTAVALLVYVLRALSSRPERIGYYIPHRMDEGYGLNCEAVKELAAYNQLAITVDCGVVSCREADLAASLGLDLIITDHHEPGDILPDAAAVLNPKRPDSAYPFRELAGVGVAYKLVQALGERYGRDFREHLDLTALGTTADLVPLVGENRILVRHGLERLSSTDKVGLRALRDVSGLKGDLKASDLGYRLGPRLNAGGRLGTSLRGATLLLTEDPHEAAAIAKELDEANKERQELEARVVEEAVEIVERENYASEPALVLASDRWHPGVIGIAASRLVNRYYLPTVVIALDGQEGKGSGRSIVGFDLYQGLTACRETLRQFGGHVMAAGLSIDRDHLNAFRECFCRTAAECLKPEDYIPKVQVDAQITLDTVSDELIAELQRLEPCGMGNPAPVLQVSGSVINWNPVGRDASHLKCVVQDGSGCVMDAIGFGLAAAMQGHQGQQEYIGLLVQPQVNEWNGRSDLQLQIQELQPLREAETFADRWMQAYPWELAGVYDSVCWEASAGDAGSKARAGRVMDARGTRDRVRYVLQTCGASERVLVYVNTPRQALEVCRALRIHQPGESPFIGFSHGLMTADEAVECQERLTSGDMTWCVSCGPDHPGVWDRVISWDVPPSLDVLRRLAAGTRTAGVLHLLFGPSDRRVLQNSLRRRFPDRDQLASFYRGLKQCGDEGLTKEALADAAHAAALGEGLEFALSVFEELELIESIEGNEAAVRLLPTPKNKLDLTTSVLYNEGMSKKQESLQFLRTCLEGSLLDELSRQDSSHPGFS